MERSARDVQPARRLAEQIQRDARSRLGRDEENRMSAEHVCLCVARSGSKALLVDVALAGLDSGLG